MTLTTLSLAEGACRRGEGEEGWERKEGGKLVHVLCECKIFLWEQSKKAVNFIILSTYIDGNQ